MKRKKKSGDKEWVDRTVDKAIKEDSYYWALFSKKGKPYIILVAGGRAVEEMAEFFRALSNRSLYRCPKCGNYSLKRYETGWVCYECGYITEDEQGLPSPFARDIEAMLDGN